MGFFDKNTMKVAIIIYDKDGNTINRAKPQVDNMRTAHHVGRKMVKKTNHGDDYEIIQL